MTTQLPTVEGRGSVTGAPNLPDGFADTFTSRFVDAGELRLHAVIGGDGPPLLLVHGWPQTWYAWRMLMPALARDFEVIAVDQRGIGLSDKPEDGYDTGTLANDLVALMDALGHERFASTGPTPGCRSPTPWPRITRSGSSAWSSPRPSLPGISAVTAAVPPARRSTPRLWHLDLQPAPGRGERGARHGAGGRSSSARSSTPRPGRRSCPDEVVELLRRHARRDPEALRGSFELYRAFPTIIAQNEERKSRRLTMPVLAIGGEESGGESVANAMKLVADDVQGVVLPGSGHWVAEQAPDELLAALTEFLAPYRDATGWPAPTVRRSCTGPLRTRRAGPA